MDGCEESVWGFKLLSDKSTRNGSEFLNSEFKKTFTMKTRFDHLCL